MPEPGLCVCEAIADHDGVLQFMDGHVHEHSDFEPYACVEPGCGCEGFRRPGDDTETVQHADQIAPGPPNRPALTIPADALDFSRQRVTDAATHLDNILAAHTTPGNPDEPLAVLGLADILETTWNADVDPYDVLALAIRRLQDATRPRGQSARRFTADVKRRLETQRRHHP